MARRRPKLLHRSGILHAGMVLLVLASVVLGATAQFSFSQSTYAIETSSSFNSLSATLSITVRETSQGSNECQFATRSITAQPSADADTANGTMDRHLYAHSIRTPTSVLPTSEDAAFLSHDGRLYLAQLATNTLELLLFNNRSFERLHSVPVTAAKAVVGFVLADEAYFAISTLQGPTPSRFVTTSPIFKLSSNRLVAFQNISTFGASQAAFFALDGNAYLCHANYEDNAHSTRVPSIVYRYNTTSKLFLPYQNISTVGALGLVAQRIDANTFLLLFSNNYDSTTARYEVNSPVFLWNSTAARFVLLQNIATVGAASWAYTNVNGRHLFAVANTRTTAGSFSTNSVVYRWNPATRRLEPFQSIPTLAISRWTAVTVAATRCLFAAHVGLLAQGNAATSVLYCADAGTGMFSRALSFPTTNAKSACSIELNDVTSLLALAAAPTNVIKLGYAINSADYVEMSGTLISSPGINTTQSHTIPVGILLPTDMRRPGNRSFAVDVVCNGQTMDTTEVVIFNKYITLFTNQTFFLAIPENAPSLSQLAPALTWDTTVPNITFALVSGGDAFVLNSSTAELRSLRSFSSLTQPTFSLQVKATRSDDAFDLANVIVTVLDLNDNPPLFSTSHYYGVFNESQPSQTFVLRVFASDLDTGINGSITYSFVTASSDNAAKDFLIDPVTGVIRTARVFFSRNDTATYSLVVRATDGGPNGGLSTNVGVSIILQDLNLNAPQFSQPVYTVNISETTPVGSPVLALIASDLDLPGSRNSFVFFSLVPGTTSFFSVSVTGVVSLAQPLDFVAQSLHNFTVIAADGGLPARSTTARVVINVVYAIISPPTFSQSSYSSTFNDQALIGARLLAVSALPLSAPHLRRSVRYSLSAPSEFVAVNETSGEVAAIRTIFADGTPMLNVTIRAFLVGRSSLFSEVSATVIMVSVNAIPPRVTSNPSFAIAENLPAGSVVGVVVVSNVNGYGVATPVVFSFSSPSTVFHIDETSGEISTLAPLDFETTRFYSLFVIATDAFLPNKSVKQLIDVAVENQNDVFPRFLQASYNYTVAENHVGSLFAAQATDADAAGFVYSLEPGPFTSSFSVDASTGLISIITALDSEVVPASFALSLLVNDTGFPISLQAQTFVYVTLIDVNDNSPIITGPTSLLVQENASTGTSLAVFQVTDLDATQVNRDFHFRLMSGNTDNLFALSGMSLTLLDSPKTIRNYNLVLSAENIAVPSLSSVLSVEVILEAVNRFPPVFSASSYSANVIEDAPAGFSVLTVSATDNDIAPSNANVSLSLEGDATALACFQLQVTQLGKTTLASVVLNCSLDYEVQSLYSLHVVASDNGSPARTSKARLTVFVDNIIQIVPQFTRSVYTVQVNETWPLGKPFLTTFAGALRREPNLNVEYFMACSCPLFTVNSTTGQISLRDKLQYDVKSDHLIFIIAINTLAESPVPVLATVVVQVLQVNELAPVFNATNTSLTLLEDAPVNSLLVKFAATDPDRPLRPSAITFRIEETSGNAGSAFFLDSVSGELRVARALSFSLLPVHNLTISACDQATSPLCTLLDISIQLLRVNQLPPVFLNTPYFFSVLEHLPAGSRVNGTVMATDPDAFPGDRIAYSLRFPVAEFHLNASTGEITTTVMLDFLTASQRSFQLLVVANDSAAYKPRTAQTLVIIDLINIIEPPPVFLPSIFNVTLAENLPNGTLVTTARASSSDPFDQLSYFIEDLDASNAMKFYISADGTVTCDTLDFEQVTSYRLLIVVTNRHGDQISQVLNVTVEDLNDNAPQFDKQVYTFAVLENATANSTFGTVFATDLDSPPNAAFVYSLVNGDRTPGLLVNQFSIDSLTGQLSVKNLNFEDQEFYNITVRAQNMAPPFLFGEASVLVTVLDVVDAAPLFVPVGVVSIYENFTVGDIVLQLSALDVQPSRRSRLEFSLLCCHSHFTINASSGVITTVSQLDREVIDAFNLTVSVADVGDQSLTAVMTVPVQVLDINDSPPSFAQAVYTVNISEDASNVALLQVQASSRDTPVFGTIDNYYFLDLQGDLVSSNPWLSIDAAGLITVLSPFNFEQQALFTFAVVAVSRGGLQGSALVVVNVAEVLYPPPIFADPSPTFIVVNELTTAGTTIHQFQGLTADPDQALIYTLDRGDTALFALNATYGQLVLTGKLSFDAAPVHSLAISVKDNPRVERKSDLLAYVFVLDSYSELPLFDLVDLDPVQETAPRGTVVGRVRATHPRGPSFSNISYFVISGDTLGAFALDAQTGVITVAGPLDWKIRRQYRMEILAVEGSFKRRQSITNVTIEILDMNRNPPVFDLSVTSVSISEKLQRNSSVFIFTFSDSDHGVNALATFALVDGDQFGCFDLDEVTGQLFLACALDHDVTAHYQLRVRVRNVVEPFFADEMILDVHVEDVYIAPPVFGQSLYFESISETAALNSSLYVQLSLTSNDGDASVPGFQPSFALVDSFSNTFAIDPVLGVITLVGPLNWSLTSSYSLQVVGANALNVSEQALTTVSVVVIDVNDHDPYFMNAPGTINLPEDTPLGLLFTLAGEDLDLPDATHLTYDLVSHSPLVFVDTSTGDVFLMASLDFEVHPGPIPIVFSVCDNDHRPASRCGYTTVLIRVLDVNDNAPRFAAQAYSFTVPEDLALGQVVGQLNASDADAGMHSLLQFTLEQGQNSAPFFIDAQGNLLLVSPLDFESTATYSFFATVSDGLFVDKVAVRVIVTNVNDNLPVFVSPTTFRVSEKLDVGQQIGVILATDADVQPVNYSISANGFVSVNAATGVLSLAGRLDSSMGAFTLTAFAWDRTPREYAQQSLSPTSIVITVTVLNDSRAPVFNQSLYSVNISEYTLPEPQSSVLTLAAQDVDNPQYPIRFSLLTNTSLFTLQSDGVLRLSSSIALIRTSTIRLTVQAVNPLYPRLRSTARVVINIEHLNNYAPTFSAAYYTVTLRGLKGPAELVTTVRATDRDFGRAGQLGYEISADNSQNRSVVDELLSSGYDPTTVPFTIDGEGRVFTTSSIGSLYGPSMYSVTIIANDRGSPSRSSSVVLYVFIEHDLTIDTPTFTAPSVLVHLGELTPLNTLCFTAAASTSNPESQALIGYYMAAASVAHVFSVDLRTGDVINNQPFNLSVYGSYVIVIAAFNVKRQELFSLQMVEFTIDNENAHAPQILATSPRDVFASEALSVGDVVATVLASDADADRNGQLRFSLSSTDDAFEIESNTGEIRVAKRLKSHAHPRGYLCTVTVTDRATQPLFNFTTVTVFVVNSQRGPIFSQSFYSGNISEDALPGTRVTSVQARDFFGDSRNITFQLASCSVAPVCPFAIDAFSGAVLVQASALDYEAYAAVTLEVEALDDESNTNVAFVFIELLDVNDNAPAFPASSIAVDIMAGSGFQTLGVFSALDADAGRNAQLTYTIVSIFPPEYISHFAYDPVFGLLALVAPVNFQQVRFINISLQAEDAGTPALYSPAATVFVTVIDNKDNKPVFDSSVFHGQIAENKPIGQYVTRVSAKVLDGRGNALSIPIVYRLLQTTAFVIDAVTGDISSATTFDRESIDEYDFFVMAVDGTGFTAMASVRVTIADENDNSPAFAPWLPRIVEVAENALQPVALTMLTATDADVGVNGRVSFDLMPSGESASFAIDNETGALATVAPLDAELLRQFVLNVAATDGGSPASTTLFSLTVMVRDVNDNAPRIALSQSRLEIDESLPAATILLVASYTDADVGDNAVARFEIVSGNEAGFFALSPTTGELTVVMLDYSVQHQFALRLRAENHLVSPALFTEDWVYINLTDTTKPPPQFGNSSYFASVRENSSPSLIITVIAADVDPSPPAFPMRLEYAIAEKLANPAFPFSINPTTGVVFTSGPLDRELMAAYDMTIEVVLFGYLPLKSTTMLRVAVLDVNDNNPQIIPTDAVQVDELLAVGTVVYIAQAFDSDEGANAEVTFELQDGLPYFAIEPFSGVVTLASVVTYATFESRQTSITVVCRDRGEPQRSNTSVITVMFRDVNDHAPEFVSSSLLEVMENISAGTVLTMIETRDEDYTLNAFVSVAIASGNEDAVFELHPAGALTLRKALDREARDHYELTIVASNPQASSPQATTQVVRIQVLDVNDNAPVFDSFTGDLVFPENISLGSEIAALRATDLDIGRNGLVRYALVVPGGSFAIDPWTGVVRVHGALDAERQRSFNVSVTAYDEGSPMLSTTIVLNISLVPLNNRFPVFTGELVARINLSETQANNSVIYTANARGFSVAPVQAYAIVSGSQGHFAIHPATGRVSLVRPLNWSVFALYNIVISASNAGGLVSHMTLVVSVIDTNNNRPAFDSASYSANLNENELGQRPIVRVAATDVDQGMAGTAGIRYSIDVGPSSERFLIDPVTGWILAIAPFDFEAERNRVIVVRVRAADSGVPQQTRVVFVFVTIMDVFDDWPIFAPRIYPTAVPETAPIGATVAMVSAFDWNRGLYGPIVYSLQNPLPGLEVDATSGRLFTTNLLAEQLLRKNFLVYVQAANSRGLDVAMVNISVIEAFPNVPYFAPAHYAPVIAEDTSAGSLVVQVKAFDQNLGDNGPISFFITDATSPGAFSINQTTGELIVASTLDRETQPWHMLQVVATFDAEFLRSPSLPARVERSLHAEQRLPMGRSRRNTAACSPCSSARSMTECGATCVWEPQLGLCRPVACSDFVLRDDCISQPSCIFEENSLVCLDNSTVLPCEGYSLESICPQDRCLWQAAEGFCAPLSSPPACTYRSARNCHSGCTTSVFSSACISNSSCQAFPSASCPFGCFVDLIGQCQDLPPQPECYPTLLGRLVTSTSSTTMAPTTSASTTTTSTSTSTSATTTTTIAVTTTAPTTMAQTTRSTTAPHTTPTNPPQFSSPTCSSCTWTYINVTLTDVNDNAPTLSCPSRVVYNENTTVNTVLFSCGASDADLGLNGMVTFRLANHTPEFEIDRLTGQVSLASGLDVLRAPAYVLVVIAEDHGSPSLETSATVTVEVMDVNDFPPRFSEAVYSWSVVENTPAGAVLGRVQASDLDLSMNGAFSFAIVNGSRDALAMLSLDAITGEVTLLAAPDRETISSYTLYVRCTDQGLTPLSSDAMIVVSVLDTNDNYPTFSTPTYFAALLENQEQFLLVTHVQASDPDSDANGTAGIVFQLSSQSDSRFALDPRTGDILVTQPVLYNENKLVILTVIAVDQFGTGEAPLSTTVEVRVTILPRNLHRPIFSAPAYAATLDEFLPVGSSTGVTVNATDLDQGGGFGVVTYELHDTTGDFSINVTTGEVFVNSALDWNRQTRYIVPVIAKDVDQRFDLVYVTFNITYNLLHPEPKFVQATYKTQISENAPFGTLLDVVPHAVDVVNGLSFPFQYFISQADTAWFSVEPVSGNITVSGPIDREIIFNGRSVSMTVTALYLPNGRSTTCTVVVSVLDENDNAPRFAATNYSFSHPENLTVGSLVGIVSASDIDAGANMLFKFFIVERTVPVSIDPATGEIFLTAALDREQAGSHLFTVRATDSGGLFAQTGVTLTVLDVNDNTPVLNSVLVPFGSSTIQRNPAGLISSVVISEFNETYCLSGPCNDARTVLALVATDRDVGANGQTSVELVSPSPFVSIDAIAGRVFLRTAVDRDTAAQFSFQLRLFDLGTPRLSVVVNVSVLLADLNDNRPQIGSLPSIILVSEAAGGVPLSFVTASDADATQVNNMVEYFAQSGTADVYFADSIDGAVVRPGAQRILSAKRLVYQASSPQANLHTVNMTVRNSMASPALVSGVSQVTVQVVPFIGNDTVPDATKVLFDWRFPSICLSGAASHPDCALPAVSKWTTSSQVEIWTQRSYACTNVSCFAMVVSPVTPSVCECLVYGPTLPGYDASARQFLLSGMISGSANAFQLRMYNAGQLQHATSWQNKIVQSFVPHTVQFSPLSMLSFNVTWSAPPTPNGNVLGYRVCYCLLENIPTSSCTCTGVLGASASSSPASGLTANTFARLPDSTVAQELMYNTTYSVIVELVTLLADRRQSVARSEATVFTTPAQLSAASTAEFPRGGIAGIVVGVLAALALLLLLALFVIRRRRRRAAEQRRVEKSSSVDAIIESNLSRQAARQADSRARTGPIAETAPDGGFHYYTQERSDQFLGTGSTGADFQNRDSTTDSVFLSMSPVGESQDEPDSLATTMTTFGNSLAPSHFAPQPIDETRYHGQVGTPPSSQLLRSVTQRHPPQSQQQEAQGPALSRQGLQQDSQGSPVQSPPQSQPQSPLPQQKNFGLRGGHVLDGDMKGELIPRTNSRSSPFVSRKRSAEAGLGSTDPLTLQFNGHVLTSHAVVINSVMASKIASLKSTAALDEEFAAVKEQSAGFDTPCTEAKEPYNVRKNRYVNVLPPNASRVCLSHNGVLGSDYINANYIDGFQTKNAFIATQGPLATTVQDFWRMIWEENCAVILNTTPLEESGRPKCHKYWPEPGGTIQCGILEISSPELPLKRDGYTRRVLVLRNTKTSKERTVVHLMYDAWPDHGAPASPDQVLAMLKEAHVARATAAQQGVNGPMVVHCSAGLGRTGVLCGIDICLQRAQAVGNFDVFATVLHMRRQRPGMVQTAVQYSFIFDAVARANAAIVARPSVDVAAKESGPVTSSTAPAPTAAPTVQARSASDAQGPSGPPLPPPRPSLDRGRQQEEDTAPTPLSRPSLVQQIDSAPPSKSQQVQSQPAITPVARVRVSDSAPALAASPATPENIATPGASNAPLTAAELQFLEQLGGDAPRDMASLLRGLAAI